MGGMDTNGRVRRARAASDEGDARFAGQLAPGFGHVGDAAFLPADDEMQLVANIVERVERSQEALAWNAKHGIDAMQSQAVDEDPSTGAGGRWGVGRHISIVWFIAVAVEGHGSDQFTIFFTTMKPANNESSARASVSLLSGGMQDPHRILWGQGR